MPQRADCQLAITDRRSRDGTITSARLVTKDRFAVQYGLIEARIKVPGGAWPGNDTDTPVLPATLLVDWIRIRMMTAG